MSTKRAIQPSATTARRWLKEMKQVRDLLNKCEPARVLKYNKDKNKNSYWWNPKVETEESIEARRPFVEAQRIMARLIMNQSEIVRALNKKSKVLVCYMEPLVEMNEDKEDDIDDLD